MNRRERRNARVAHKKTIQDNNKMLLRSNNKEEVSEHRTLFDKVFSKKSGGTPVKCQGIYDSVFCRG